MKVTIAILAALGLAGTACAHMQGGGVELKKADGTAVATATVTEAAGGINVEVHATGLPAGTYGAHIHAVGRCEGPGFESAGPHWNPASRQHGSENPQGHHLGDLPNLTVTAQGGHLAFSIPGATFSGEHGLFDGDGAAIVIHAGPDDYRTDPSGNSGGRIACAVLTRP